MLEKIDLNKKVDKKNYREAMDKAGERLGLLQRECKAEGIPVMIVFEGMGAAGKGVQINRLIQAMDPRGFDVYACNRSNEEEQMLDEACLEVVQEDPLGAYAVEYIKYSVTPIVGSYEANVQITYRRTREQVAAIVDATGTAAIRSELSEALSEFSSEVVLRISYFEEDSEYIRQLMREAYLSNPASALDFPDAQITMYPETGQRRIVEVLLTYHQSRQTLESRRNSLQREADRLLTQAGVQEDVLSQLVRLVRQTCSYQEGGGSTAYDALLEGTADSQGMALALALLCQRTQPALSCTVVDGQWNGVSHLWNVVQTAGGYRHVDLTQSGEPVFRTDQEMAAAGYTWDSERVPVCTAEEET